jgi:hypothetical protein
MLHHRNTCVVIAAVIGLAITSAKADVIEFNEDKEGWEVAAGAFTTIDFTGFEEGTWIFEQYAHLGAHFIDGANIIQESDLLYLEDGWGIIGNNEVRITFDEPTYSIAGDFPGLARFDLYWQGEMIYYSPFFGGSGVGHFGGVVSDQPFDEVRIWDIDEQVFIDDLHFGPPIPGPGVVVVLAAGALVAGRRRRDPDGVESG